MSRFTPGPWKVVEDSYGNTVVTGKGMVVEIGLEHIAKVGGLAEHEANARLIAAAPELLEALINLRDNFDYPPAAYEVILNAIAKAEGRES